MTAPRVVAVTGGSGQLGTHVLRRLVALPDIDKVISLDRRPPYVASDKLYVVTADVRDADLVRHLDGVDAVIHCAFIIQGQERTSAYRAVNVEGSRNVFAAAAAAGVKSIAFVSSITAYGCFADHPVPIVEATARRRQAAVPYAACKFDVEEVLDGVEPLHPDVAISRIRANVLLGRKMPHLLGHVLHVGWLPDLGGTPLPIVWDEDVADLLVLAMQKRARGAFNAAADDLRPSPDLAEKTGMMSVGVWRVLLWAHGALYTLTSRLGLHVMAHPSWVTQTRGARLIATSERAKAELGWSPRQPTALAVLQRFIDVSPWILDLRLLVVLWLSGLLARSLPDLLSRQEARIFLCLDGPVGGDFALRVSDGVLSVRAGAPALPTSTVTLRAQMFRDLVAGRASAEWIDGAVEVQGRAADRAVFARIVGILSAARRAGGWRGVAARMLAKCI